MKKIKIQFTFLCYTHLVVCALCNKLPNDAILVSGALDKGAQKNAYLFLFNKEG